MNIYNENAFRLANLVHLSGLGTDLLREKIKNFKVQNIYDNINEWSSNSECFVMEDSVLLTLDWQKWFLGYLKDYLND